MDGVDRRTAEEKAIDDWLPVTSSRTAKWWYSTFHNVTAMVGAGVLSLPYAMSSMGWGAGVTMMILSWIITLYTLWQMVEMHEMVPGKRFDRYHELGQHAFGEKLGLYIVVPQQLVVEVSTCIIYMVTGGKSLKKTHQSICPNCKDIKLTYFILIFGSIHFVLSHLPNFNSISVVSLAAAVMSLTYSTIAWTASLAKGGGGEADYGLRGSNAQENMFNFFNALGEIAFAFAGHNVVLEIQATIPSTPEKPSKKAMWKGVIFAYLVVALCYFPVAFVGYYIFGNEVDDNILLTLQKPRWLIACANLFVFVHVIGGYQIFAMPVFNMLERDIYGEAKAQIAHCLCKLVCVYQIYAMPVFDMLETYMVKHIKWRPSFGLRFTTRTLYVAITMFIGMTFPFFGGLVGFFGGFALAPTTYFLPCIIWLKIVKPEKYGVSWTINWVLIILGFVLMTVAPIGGLRNIILSAKTYKFYQ